MLFKRPSKEKGKQRHRLRENTYKIYIWWRIWTFNIKNTYNSITSLKSSVKWAKHLNPHFTTEDVQMSNKYMKSSFSSLFTVVVHLISCVQLFVTPWFAAHQALLSFTIFWSEEVDWEDMLRFTSVELAMLSNHLILCHPLLLPSIFPSIRVFPNESALCIRWPNYWGAAASASVLLWIFRSDFL